MASIATPFPGLKPRTRAKRPRHQRTAGRAEIPALFSVKRVDNSRLRREVNPQHRRECLTRMGFGVVIFIFVFLYSWQRYQCVQFGYAMEQLKSQRSGLEEANHKLRVEQAEMANPLRIDTEARQAGLGMPSPLQVIRVGKGGEAPEGPAVYARSLSNHGLNFGPNPGPASGDVLSRP